MVIAAGLKVLSCVSLAAVDEPGIASESFRLEGTVAAGHRADGSPDGSFSESVSSRFHRQSGRCLTFLAHRSRQANAPFRHMQSLTQLRHDCGAIACDISGLVCTASLAVDYPALLARSISNLPSPESINS